MYFYRLLVKSFTHLNKLFTLEKLCPSFEMTWNTQYLIPDAHFEGKHTRGSQVFLSLLMMVNMVLLINDF